MKTQLFLTDFFFSSLCGVFVCDCNADFDLMILPLQDLSFSSTTTAQFFLSFAIILSEKNTKLEQRKWLSTVYTPALGIYHKKQRNLSFDMQHCTLFETKIKR